MFGQRLDTLFAERRVGKIVVNHIRRVGAGLSQRGLAAGAMLDDQSEGIRATADGIDEPRRRDMPEMAGDGLGTLAPEQLVDVVGVDPEQDQRLIERQRTTIASSTGP